MSDKLQFVVVPARGWVAQRGKEHLSDTRKRWRFCQRFFVTQN
jgi:hypothetical protein